MNNPNPFDTQIEAYYTGSLSPEDKQSFEQSLKTNKGLQEAFKPYQLFDKAIQVVGEQQLQLISQRMATEIGSLPVPQLSFWERFTLFFTQTPSADTAWFKRPQWRIGFAGLSTSMAFCLLYANIFVMSYEEIPVSKSFGYQLEFVGTKGNDSKTAFSDGENLYNNNRVEALQKMASHPDNVVAAAGGYYLAHLYLKNKNFDAAIAAFDKTLQADNVKILQNESLNIGTIKINRLLAVLGKNKDKTETNRLIDVLSNDPDCRTEKAKLEAIRKEVNNPWRFLKFN